MIRTVPFYTRMAHIGICILVFGFLAIIGKTILSPLIMALLFAMLLVPMANFLERKWRFPRSLACFVSVLILLAVVSGILLLLINQFTEFAQDIPVFQQQLTLAVANLQDWITRTFNVNNKQQLDYINTGATDVLGQGTLFIGHTLLSLSSTLLFMVFTFLYTFFIMMHRNLLLRFAVALFHEKHSPVVYEVVAQIQYITRKYITGLALQMGIVMVLTCIALETIGVKYAFLLSVLTGLLNVIPYIGIFISMLLSVLITFTTSDPTHVLFVVIAMACIHLIDGNYIMPKIVGSKVKLNTLTALLGLVMGEMMWGITGMFLSIPVIAIMKVIFDRVDGLKPWGMVLGDEEITVKQKKIIAEEILPEQED